MKVSVFWFSSPIFCLMLKSRGVSSTIALRTQNCVPIAHLKPSCDTWSLLPPTWERRGCGLSLGTLLILIGYSEKKNGLIPLYAAENSEPGIELNLHLQSEAFFSACAFSPLCFILSMVANMATSCRLLLPGVISGSGNASFSHFSDIDFSEEKGWWTFLFLCVTIVPRRRLMALFPHAIIFITFSQKISKSFYVCI